MTSWRLVHADGSDPELLTLSPVLAETLALSVAAGDAPPTLLIRRQRPYVLLGPSDARLPRVGQGVEVCERRGLPVYVRISGGTAVLLDDDCLSFAVITPCRDLTRLRANYHELAAGVVEALGDLGVAAGFGEAPGSFCPGPYDLVSDGRKVVGISQALRRGFANVGGMVLVRQQPAAAVATLEAFYRAAGDPRRFEPSAITHLEERLGRPVSSDEVARAIIAAYGRRGELDPGPLTPQERRRARDLLVRRRLAASRSMSTHS